MWAKIGPHDDPITLEPRNNIETDANNELLRKFEEVT